MKIHNWPNLVTANWAPRGKGLYLLYTPLFPQALALGLATVGIERILAKSKWINEYYQQDKNSELTTRQILPIKIMEQNVAREAGSLCI